MKRSFITFCLLCSQCLLGSIENSVIPSLEKFEILENLPQSKYSTRQYAEISAALSHKDKRIRIASYNMLFNLYDHNLDDVNRWPQRFPRIVELLNEMQPDILGIQELYASQLEDLMPHIESSYAFYSKPCSDGELNGILYRKDRFEVVSKKVWYMTKTPEVPSSETLTMLQLKDLNTGKTLAFFNVHLAFSKIEKRDFQARFIAEHLESFAAQMPVILTGDLNTFPHRLDLEKLPFLDGDFVQRTLTQGSLKNAKEVSILGHLGPLSTFTNGSGEIIPFTGTGEPGVILDHIFVSKGLDVLMHAVQPATVNGHFPSDHMPVLADLILVE